MSLGELVAPSIITLCWEDELPDWKENCHGEGKVGPNEGNGHPPAKVARIEDLSREREGWPEEDHDQSHAASGNASQSEDLGQGFLGLITVSIEMCTVVRFDHHGVSLFAKVIPVVLLRSGKGNAAGDQERRE